MRHALHSTRPGGNVGVPLFVEVMIEPSRVPGGHSLSTEMYMQLYFNLVGVLGTFDFNTAVAGA